MGLISKFKKIAKIPQEFNASKRREQHMINYLRSWNGKLNIDDVGNLYLINEGTPLVCAHMDTVQTYQELDKVTTDHIRIQNMSVNRGTKMNPKRSIETIIDSDIQIGGDDKCGVAIAMELYEKLGDKISLLFTVGEETGRIGSQHFAKNNKKLLEKCLYCIVPDRRNGSDLLCNSGHGYGSKEFESAILEHLEPYGFETATGSICDADSFKNILNCFNISTGYYEPHTSSDRISVDEFENTYEALENLVTNYREKLEPNKTTSYNYGSYKKYKSSVTQGRLIGSIHEDGYDEHDYTWNGYDYTSKKKSKKKDELDMANDLFFVDTEEGFIYAYEDIEILTPNTETIILPKGQNWFYEANSLESFL